MAGVKRSLALLATICALSACASMGRVTQYPSGMRDAKVDVGGREFSLWFHRTDATILVQRSLPGIFAEMPGAAEPMPFWRAAAQAPLAELGCEIIELYELGQPRVWEVRYQCPDGRPVSADLLAERRSTWRDGFDVPSPLARPRGE